MAYTPLIMAVQIQNIDILEILVSAGADVNAKNDAVSTPLDLANEHGKTATAVFLSSVR